METYYYGRQSIPWTRWQWVVGWHGEGAVGDAAWWWAVVAPCPRAYSPAEWARFVILLIPCQRVRQTVEATEAISSHWNSPIHVAVTVVFTRVSESGVMGPPWSLHSSRFSESFSAFFLFSSSFFSRASFFVTFTVDKKLASISLASFVASDVRAHFHSRILSSSLNRWKDGSTRSRFVEMMFFCLWHLTDVVPPVIAMLLSNVANLPSAPRFVIGAYCSSVSSVLVSPPKNETSANCLCPWGLLRTVCSVP